jgi:hypothetical protein
VSPQPNAQPARDAITVALAEKTDLGLLDKRGIAVRSAAAGCSATSP